MSALIDSQSVSISAAVDADDVTENTLAVQQSAHAILSHATILTAPHSRMVRSAENVRKKPRDLTELLALVRAQGLLQNLACFEQRRDGVLTGKLEVAAGDGRWQVVGILIADGTFPEDFQIHYLLVSEEEAVLVSLAENLGRAPMHPADIFDAMLKLARHDHSVADIALAFGVSELTVRQRMKLANVSPQLFALYRDDKANYEQMTALAISDSHAEQEAAWDALAPTRPAYQLRRLLTAQRASVLSDRVARYVGVKTFESAGGVVDRDLFSSGGEGYIADVALLESLAHSKLQRIAGGLKRERWAWIDVRARIDTAELALYGRVRTVSVAADAEQVAALARLDERAAALNARAVEGDASKDDSDGDVGAVDSVVRELSQIDIERGRILAVLRQPDPGDRALAGALLSIDSEGKPCVHRGLIRPEDKSRMGKVAIDRSVSVEGGGRKARAVHSEKLTLLLSAQRTLALRAELVRQPEVALLVLAHRLISCVFDVGERGASAVQLETRQPVLPEASHSGGAWAYWEAQREALAAQLPPTAGGAALMEWLRRQPRATVDSYLAFCTACAVNGLQTSERSATAVDALARTVSLDMHAWWQPTAQDYFAHVSKARMMEVVSQAISPATAVPLEKMPKEAAAEAAARALADSDWLPPLFLTEQTGRDEK